MIPASVIGETGQIIFTAKNWIRSGSSRYWWCQTYKTIFNYSKDQ